MEESQLSQQFLSAKFTLRDGDISFSAHKYPVGYLEKELKAPYFSMVASPNSIFLLRRSPITCSGRSLYEDQNRGGKKPLFASGFPYSFPSCRSVGIYDLFVYLCSLRGVALRYLPGGLLSVLLSIHRNQGARRNQSASRIPKGFFSYDSGQKSNNSWRNKI